MIHINAFLASFLFLNIIKIANPFFDNYTLNTEIFKEFPGQVKPLSIVSLIYFQ